VAPRTRTTTLASLPFRGDIAYALDELPAEYRQVISVTDCSFDPLRRRRVTPGRGRRATPFDAPEHVEVRPRISEAHDGPVKCTVAVTLSTSSERGTASASRRGRTTPSQVDLQSAGATDWEARSSAARRLLGSDGYPPLTGRIAPVM
jgi:hypothetical protein